MDNISVGDYAEALMAQSREEAPVDHSLKPTPSHLPQGVDDQAPDISHIEVPVDFVTSLMEGGEDPLVDPPEVVVESSPQDQVFVENDLHSLLQEVKSLLEEVKMQLIETTTCGMLGTNQGGATTKETEEEDPMKDILRKVRKKRRIKK